MKMIQDRDEEQRKTMYSWASMNEYNHGGVGCHRLGGGPEALVVIGEY